MINYISKKICFKKVLISLSFLMFLIKIYANLDVFIKILHTKMNAFINKVRTLQEVDSVKTLLIQVQNMLIELYKKAINNLLKKCVIDSMIINLNNKKILQLSKKLPFFMTRTAFYGYGILTVLLIAGLLR